MQSPAIAVAPTSAPACQGRLIKGDIKAGARIPMATPRHVLDGPSNGRPSRISKPLSTGIEQRFDRSRFRATGAAFATPTTATPSAIARREICIVAHFRTRVCETASFGSADVSEHAVCASKPGERKVSLIA